MCGIFALINNDNAITQRDLTASFEKGRSRGPEFSILEKHDNIDIGFHRLAINGLNTESNQPFDIANCLLICNGEIYNFRELAKENNLVPETDSDCEIIIHMYRKFGIEYTLNILDGVFAFFLYDRTNKTAYAGRDPYGVRPLYMFEEAGNTGFASELKVLYDLVTDKSLIHQFPPGHYAVISKDTVITRYTAFTFGNIMYANKNEDHDNPSIVSRSIVDYLSYAVKKRVIGTTERPVACLLSGGLDSSLIAALVNKYIVYCNGNNINDKPVLKTFSIGLPGSEDLKYARIVADHIGSDHHEVVVSEEDFFNAIPEVIQAIESYDTTTVRASVGNYLIAKYIKANTDCKVIFNGDGADELMGGYLYMRKAPDAYEFDAECRRLLRDIHQFDVLRSDKSISSHGLEPRTPFLDRGWVEFYLSIDRQLRYKPTVKNCEKFLIRKAFTTVMPELLPESILWRKKEAFSDGVSSLDKSWFQIIQEKIESTPFAKETIEEYNKKNEIYGKDGKDGKDGKVHNKPTTTEQAYYRYIFNNRYLGCDHVIDYFWMPKYVDAKDASARTLSVYNQP